MRRTKARLGENLSQCDYCGMVYYSSQIRKNWKGEMVCYGPGTRNDWEQRNTVDFIRSLKDSPGIKDTYTGSIGSQSVTNTVLYWLADYTADDFGNNLYVSP